MLEKLLIAAIVASAAAFLASRLYRILKAKGCGACSRCAAPQPPKLTIRQTESAR